jgi:hypothetical protein
MTDREIDMRKRILKITALPTMIIMVGCVVYGPVSPPPPPPEPVYSHRPATLERSWNAALDAMEDSDVSIVSADRESGIIRGVRGSADATVTVRTQADGRVRVGFSARGDEGLADQIYRAYERRMGR